MNYPKIIINNEKYPQNSEKLDEIFIKLGINHHRDYRKFKKIILNNKNSNSIIRLLEEYMDMHGLKSDHFNNLRLFYINRELKQLGSPVWGSEFLIDYSKLYCILSDWEYLTVQDIIKEYCELRFKQDKDTGLAFKPHTKENIRDIIQYLIDNDVFYMSLSSEIFENPWHSEEELKDILPLDKEIRVIKIK